MSFRSIPAALLTSLVLHVSAGASLYYWTANAKESVPSKEITISYVGIPGPVLPVKKEIKPAKIPLHAPRPPAKGGSASGGKPVKATSYAPTPPPAPQVQAVARPKTSAELLADPKRGKIFSSYFAAVKEKIYRALEENYGAHSPAAGEVTLYFVLNANGRLAKVTVVEKESSPDISLQHLAVECVKEAAPFGRFPSDLQSDQIAFQVRICFDQTD